jgi:aminoglycoside phosphotransferase (APT) family kinase protein
MIRLDVERRALRDLAGAPGVPMLRGVVATNLLAHDYAPGQVALLAGVTDAQLMALAGALAAIHGRLTDYYTIWPTTAPRHGTRTDCFRDRLASCDHFQSFHAGLPAQLHERVHALYARIEHLPRDATSWMGRSFSQLHGDASAGNILWDGDDVWLLDWEYARCGDPAEELAYLLTEQHLPELRQQFLQAAYLSAGGLPGVWERVPAYLPLVVLDSALWWADHLRARDSDPATHVEFTGRLDQAERLLNS